MEKIVKKTIYIANGLIYIKIGFLKKKLINGLNKDIKEYFNMNSDGKYSIKITKGDTYSFKKELNDSIKSLTKDSTIRRFLIDESDYNYNIYDKEGKRIGDVHIERGEELFFQPSSKKRFNITVKKLK